MVGGWVGGWAVEGYMEGKNRFHVNIRVERTGKPTQIWCTYNLASYPGLQYRGKAWYTLSVHARNYIVRDVNRWVGLTYDIT